MVASRPAAGPRKAKEEASPRKAKERANLRRTVAKADSRDSISNSISSSINSSSITRKCRGTNGERFRLNLRGSFALQSCKREVRAAQMMLTMTG